MAAAFLTILVITRRRQHYAFLKQMPLLVKRHVHEAVQTEASVYTMIYIGIIAYPRVLFRVVHALQSVLVTSVVVATIAVLLKIDMCKSMKPRNMH